MPASRPNPVPVVDSSPRGVARRAPAVGPNLAERGAFDGTRSSRRRDAREPVSRWVGNRSSSPVHPSRRSLMSSRSVADPSAARDPAACVFWRESSTKISKVLAVRRVDHFSLTRGVASQQRRFTMSVNVGKLSAEEKEKMYSAATTEMEYRVELFNKSVPCDRPTAAGQPET